MPEPSSGEHYMLLPLTRDKNISIGALSSFAAAKLTVVSKYGGGNMGVHLKLPPNFSLQLDSGDLVDKPALSHGPVWRNKEMSTCGKDRQPLLANGKTVAMESPIKVAPIDHFTPLGCTALTNVGYEPKFANDAFTFRETVEEMWQCFNKAKTEVKEKVPPGSEITEECHKVALATARVPMFASKSSGIKVAMPEGVESIDPAKYHAFLGIKEGEGEKARLLLRQCTSLLVM